MQLMAAVARPPTPGNLGEPVDSNPLMPLCRAASIALLLLSLTAGASVAGAEEEPADCGGVPATIVGDEDGDGVITGTDGHDVIVGTAGSCAIRHTARHGHRQWRPP